MNEIAIRIKVEKTENETARQNFQEKKLNERLHGVNFRVHIKAELIGCHLNNAL